MLHSEHSSLQDQRVICETTACIQVHYRSWTASRDLTHAHAHHWAAAEAVKAVTPEAAGLVHARAVTARVVRDATLVDVGAVRAVRVDCEAGVTRAHEAAHRVAEQVNQKHVHAACKCLTEFQANISPSFRKTFLTIATWSINRSRVSTLSLCRLCKNSNVIDK